MLPSTWTVTVFEPPWLGSSSGSLPPQRFFSRCRDWISIVRFTWSSRRSHPAVDARSGRWNDPPRPSDPSFERAREDGSARTVNLRGLFRPHPTTILPRSFYHYVDREKHVPTRTVAFGLRSSLRRIRGLVWSMAESVGSPQYVMSVQGVTTRASGSSRRLGANRRSLIKCRMMSRYGGSGGPTDPTWNITERIHFFTAEGSVVTLPGRRLNLAGRSRKPLSVARTLPSWEEQGLCVGSTFQISATNGHDFGRKFLAHGFCQCTDTLSEAVELTVVGRGGTVVLREVDEKGLSKRLDMSVAVPALWGVPPELEYLQGAMKEGGGIVHRVWREYIL